MTFLSEYLSRLAPAICAPSLSSSESTSEQTANEISKGDSPYYRYASGKEIGLRTLRNNLNTSAMPIKTPLHCSFTFAPSGVRVEKITRYEAADDNGNHASDVPPSCDHPLFALATSSLA